MTYVTYDTLSHAQEVQYITLSQLHFVSTLMASLS